MATNAPRVISSDGTSNYKASPQMLEAMKAAAKRRGVSAKPVSRSTQGAPVSSDVVAAMSAAFRRARGVR